MTMSISIGSPLPSMRCFVPGHRARTVAAIGEGECLVLYVGGLGVRSSNLDLSTRWPLPTLPRTTYAVVDHETATHGFLRTHMIEDPAGEVRRTVAPPSSVIRAVVMNIDRTVVAIVDEKDPSALRSQVGQALVATLIGSGYAASGSTPATAMVAALAGRAEMVLSPLVARVTQVSPTSDSQVKAFGLEVELEVLLHLDDHFGEAIERLVAVGYGFVGDCGVAGRDVLVSPTDEPIHALQIVSSTSVVTPESHDAASSSALESWGSEQRRE